MGPGEGAQLGWWQTEAGEVRGRAGTVLAARSAAWRAGRRRRVVKLQDVVIKGGEYRARAHSIGCDEQNSSPELDKFSSEFGDCDTVISACAVEAAMVVARGERYGSYAVGSRWHEQTLIGMKRQFGSVSLAWRYGDVVMVAWRYGDVMMVAW